VNSPSFREIEGLLAVILQEMSTLFTNDEAKEVFDFIEVGEYGLALQTFVDVVLEEDKKIPATVLQMIEQLSEAMEMQEVIDWTALRGTVR
jgi:hypothetical protein